MIAHRLFCLVRFDLLEMFMRIFQRLILQQDFCRGFLADARQSRDIVCRIAHQRFQIDDLFRKKTVFFQHLCRVVIFDRRHTLHGLWNPDQNVVRCKLQQVAVSGHDRNFHALRLAFAAECSEDVICLIALFGDDFNVHRCEHFLYHRDLFTQLLRHRLSRSLVLVIHLVAECRCMEVKCHGEVLRLLLIENFEQNVQESIYGVRVQAFCIGQIRYAVKSPVQNTVSVQ